MVSGAKLRYFDERLSKIVHDKYLEIDRMFPDIKTDYQTLIFQGKGKMIHESRIREIVGDLRHSCPLMVDVSKLFVFAKEQQEAELVAKARYDRQQTARAVIRAKEKSARDLVYFGKDDQFLSALKDLEDYIIPQN